MIEQSSCRRCLPHSGGEAATDVIVLTEDTRLAQQISIALLTFDADSSQERSQFFTHRIHTPAQVMELLDSCYNSCLLLLDLDSTRDRRTVCRELMPRLERISGELRLVVFSKRDEDAAWLFAAELWADDFINKHTQDPARHLLRYLRRTQSHQVAGKRLPMYSSGILTAVEFHQIFYIETIKGTHKCVVVCRDAAREIWADLCQLRQQLDARFILCRPSTVANIQQVRRIDLRQRTLHFSETISCSFSERNKSVIKAAFEYNCQGGFQNV